MGKKQRERSDKAGAARGAHARRLLYARHVLVGAAVLLVELVLVERDGRRRLRHGVPAGGANTRAAAAADGCARDGARGNARVDAGAAAAGHLDRGHCETRGRERGGATKQE